MAARACECDAAQHRQELIEMLTLLLVPIDHLEALVAFEERRQLESPNPMLLGLQALLRTSWRRLRPAGSPEAPFSAHMPKAAPGSGQSRPTSRLGGAGHAGPAMQPCFRDRRKQGAAPDGERAALARHQ